jgi:hypothetical protein
MVEVQKDSNIVISRVRSRHPHGGWRFNIGDRVAIRHGMQAGKRGIVVKINPWQGRSHCIEIDSGWLVRCAEADLVPAD